MKTNIELKNLTLDELQAKLLVLRKEQFNLRVRKVNGSLDKPHVISKTRRDIARIKTFMSEKVGKNDDK